MPRKFDQDAKDRVVRLVEDRILAENMSMQAACQAVAPKLGVSWHTARQWTQQARRAGNIPEPVPEDLAAENARLRRENQELRDTNELLMRLPSFSGHPICTDLVSVGEDVHCESTAQEVHAGVPA